MATGRPSSYKPEYAAKAAELCAQGATDAELADAFGVSIQTVKNWKAAHPEFLASLKLHKESADQRVEASLYQRAMGYEAEETDIRVINGEMVMTPIKKLYPPDTTAAIFWLKNRKPAEWRDRQEITGSGGKDLIPEMAPADVARELAFILAKGAADKDKDGS
jgi:hypothetical protein